MHKKISLAQANGKTIDNIQIDDASGQMIIAFTDATYLGFRAVREYEDIAPSIESNYFSLGLFNEKSLIDSGIVSAEDLEKLKIDKRRENEVAQETRYRALYAWLKDKYERDET